MNNIEMTEIIKETILLTGNKLTEEDFPRYYNLARLTLEDLPLFDGAERFESRFTKQEIIYYILAEYYLVKCDYNTAMTWNTKFQESLHRTKPKKRIW